MNRKLERKALQVEDGEISYLCGDIKPGRPNVHLFHATGFNANTYRQILEPLSEYFNVYACDLRGHGLGTTTANPENFKSWDVYREDFYKFLDAINEPMYLIGHSVGSVVSIAGAIKRPELIKGLILTEPLIYPEMPADMFGQNNENNPMVVGARKRRAEFPSKEFMVENYVGKGAFKTWGRSWIENYVEGGSRRKDENTVELSCRPEWEAKSFLVAEMTPWDDIKKLQCPSSIAYATGDGFSTCYKDGVDKYLSIHPNTKVITSDEASHFLPMEKPELVIELVLDMIKSEENLPLSDAALQGEG